MNCRVCGLECDTDIILVRLEDGKKYAFCGDCHDTYVLETTKNTYNKPYDVIG